MSKEQYEDKEKEKDSKKKYPCPYPDKDAESQYNNPQEGQSKKEKLGEDIMKEPEPIQEPSMKQMQQPLQKITPLGSPKDSQNQGSYVEEKKEVQEVQKPTEEPKSSAGTEEKPDDQPELPPPKED